MTEEFVSTRIRLKSNVSLSKQNGSGDQKFGDNHGRSVTASTNSNVPARYPVKTNTDLPELTDAERLQRIIGVGPYAGVIEKIREIGTQHRAYQNEEIALTNRMRSLCLNACEGDTESAGQLLEALKAQQKILAVEAKQLPKRRRPRKPRHHPQLAKTYPAVMHFLEAHLIIAEHERNLEKELCDLVRQLPISEWWMSQEGLAEIGLARIVRAAGDLNRFRNVCKLRRYMGIGCNADGTSQRRVKGPGAKKQCFAPHKRADLSAIGGSLIRRQTVIARHIAAETHIGRASRGGGHSRGDSHPNIAAPYRLLFERKKAEYLIRGWTPLHADKAAKRYMEQQLLKHLYLKWREVMPR